MNDEMIAHVCVDGDWIPACNVEFLDIEEDISGMGRDLMTFEWGGRVYRSYVTMRWAP